MVFLGFVILFLGFDFSYSPFWISRLLIFFLLKGNTKLSNFNIFRPYLFSYSIFHFSYSKFKVNMDETQRSIQWVKNIRRKKSNVIYDNHGVGQGKIDLPNKWIGSGYHNHWMSRVKSDHGVLTVLDGRVFGVSRIRRVKGSPIHPLNISYWPTIFPYSGTETELYTVEGPRSIWGLEWDSSPTPIRNRLGCQNNGVSEEI